MTVDRSHRKELNEVLMVAPPWNARVGKASRQSLRSTPQVTQPVEHASRVPFVTATELFHLVQNAHCIQCSFVCGEVVDQLN